MFSADCPPGSVQKNEGISKFWSAYCVAGEGYVLKRPSKGEILSKAYAGEHCNVEHAGFECWSIYRATPENTPAYCIDGHAMATHWTATAADTAENACKDLYDTSCQDKYCLRLGGDVENNIDLSDVQKQKLTYSRRAEGTAIVVVSVFAALACAFAVRMFVVRKRKSGTLKGNQEATLAAVVV